MGGITFTQTPTKDKLSTRSKPRNERREYVLLFSKEHRTVPGELSLPRPKSGVFLIPSYLFRLLTLESTLAKM
jgi:hypothetical protein